MKCLICKHNHFKAGHTVLPIERGAIILVITDIPARVCENCGEPYLSEETSLEVQSLAGQLLPPKTRAQRQRGEREVVQASFR